MPLEGINAASAREKSIRHGHPSTLHLWWARRPLAACRSVLFAQLVDDPGSWPEHFPTEDAVQKERERLHTFIGGTREADYKDGLAAWESSSNEAVLEEARWYIARSLAWNRGEQPPKKSKEVRRYLLEHAPPVYDPFCGGGSIPLEAQRLGLRAMASDLNPVAVMITKALIEFPPKFAGLPPVNPEAQAKLRRGGSWNAKGAQGLAEDVRFYGKWMRDEAEKRIGRLYPKATLPDGSKATVIAWLWARTVRSPNPAAKGAMVPLASSFLLSAKGGKEAWVEIVKDDAARDGWRFRVRTTDEHCKPPEAVKAGTKSARGSFTCVLTGVPISYAYIDTEANAGCMSSRLMAIVAEAPRGRVYISPIEEHEKVASSAEPSWKPEQQCRGTFASNAQGRIYGFKVFGDYFTPRQLEALTTFSDLIAEARALAMTHAKTAEFASDTTPLAENGCGVQAYSDAVAAYLAFGVSRLADRHSSLTRWDPNPSGYAPKIANTFSRQGLPMVWDYTEGNPFSLSSGNFQDATVWIAKTLERVPAFHYSSVNKTDAAEEIDESKVIFSADPPYYDNIGYADLSDFFYIWLRRSLRDVFPTEFATMLVPKAPELVATPYRHGGKEQADRFFMSGMSRAIANMARATVPDMPVTIYYAFKQAEIEREGVVSTGWATFLEAVLAAGFQVDGTWPMRTELANRMIGRGTNALASSIVLVCRKRPEDAAVVGRAEFLRTLRRELPGELTKLQASAIAPVDMAQAAIGPGMAVFSRYAEVLEADDSPMHVRDALALISAEVDAHFWEREGEFDSHTRFAVAWFEHVGFAIGSYGDANNMAGGKNVSVEGARDAGLLEAKGGKVRLFKREELEAGWDPRSDTRLTIWECCQHLIRRLEAEGEVSAARLLKAMGHYGELARDLAYRLYIVADRKKRTEEAGAYNALIVAWPELLRLGEGLTLEAPINTAAAQGRLAV